MPLILARDSRRGADFAHYHGGMGSARMQILESDNAVGTAFSLGAMVATWQPRSHHPILWVSDPVTTAEYPDRGGIPICFPWFGSGPNGDWRPNHGLVRGAQWEVLRAEDGQVSYRISSEYVTAEAGAPESSVGAASFTGEDGSDRWQAQLDATFGESLVVSLAVTNTGSAPFTFEAALHTYIAVSDAQEVTVTGLERDPYVDTTVTPARHVTPSLNQPPVSFGQRVDRIYTSTADVWVRDEQWQRAIKASKTGSANTVVWNPGEELGATMSGIGPGRWREFVCVEAANCRDQAVTIEPGQTHVMTQTLQVETLR